MDLMTQPSLLERLAGAGSGRDWERFYGKYAAVILSFAQKRGLDEHGARDVLQETMVFLMKKLPGFTYDASRGRFRNWLLTITANKVREAFRRAHRDRLVDLDDSRGGEIGPLRDSLAADGPAADAQVESAWRQSLVEEALRRLRDDPHVQPESLAVFHAYAIENQPAATVAARFGMKENAVYQIKNRFLRRLQDDVAALENATAGANPMNPDK
jgi:RNA polymerase sigma-70 factor (ECF subfamily)